MKLPPQPAPPNNCAFGFVQQTKEELCYLCWSQGRSRTSKRYSLRNSRCRCLVCAFKHTVSANRGLKCEFRSNFRCFNSESCLRKDYFRSCLPQIETQQRTFSWQRDFQSSSIDALKVNFQREELHFQASFCCYLWWPSHSSIAASSARFFSFIATLSPLLYSCAFASLRSTQANSPYSEDYLCPRQPHLTGYLPHWTKECQEICLWNWSQPA